MQMSNIYLLLRLDIYICIHIQVFLAATAAQEVVPSRPSVVCFSHKML